MLCVACGFVVCGMWHDADAAGMWLWLRTSLGPGSCPASAPAGGGSEKQEGTFTGCVSVPFFFSSDSIFQSAELEKYTRNID